MLCDTLVLEPQNVGLYTLGGSTVCTLLKMLTFLDGPLNNIPVKINLKNEALTPSLFELTVSIELNIIKCFGFRQIVTCLNGTFTRHDCNFWIIFQFECDANSEIYPYHDNHDDGKVLLSGDFSCSNC